MTREGDIYSRTAKDESLWDQDVGFASKISGGNVVPHFVVKSKNENKYKELFINYVTQRGKGGAKYVHYDLIKIVSKAVFLALQRGRVEFGLKLCYLIYEWPLGGENFVFGLGMIF